MNMNPMDLLSMLKNKKVPSNYVNELKNNPLMKRAQEMTNGKSEDQVLQICKNICAQKGVNLDEALEMFNTMMNKH